MKWRYSLQAKISLIFFIAVFAVCLIAAGVVIKTRDEASVDFYRFAVSMAVSKDSFNENTEKFDIEKFNQNGFVLLEDENAKVDILKIYQELFEEKKASSQNRRKHNKPFFDLTKAKSKGQVYNQDGDLACGIIKYDKKAYLVLSQLNDEYLVFKIPEINRHYIPLFIFAAIVLLLCFSYIATLRSIRPLKTLRSRIKEFSEGNDEIDCKIKGNDEIAEVANEFDAAVKKIRALRHARQLFLRNIMHEFKTPIMQGKLSVEMLEADNHYRKSLEKVFIRQENLLNNFMRIEQLETGEIKLEKETFFLQDIVDYALDIIGERAENAEVEIRDDIKIDADFDLLATAIKNLLDNALLYSEDKKVGIKTIGNELIISNSGKALEFSLEDYKKPFFMQGRKQKESRGLGFGLFISLNIFDLHGIKTEYRHEDGKSIFILKL